MPVDLWRSLGHVDILQHERKLGEDGQYLLWHLQDLLALESGRIAQLKIITCHYVLGEFGEAESLYRDLEQHERLGNPAIPENRRRNAQNLGKTLTRQGNDDEAVAIVHRAFRDFDSAGGKSSGIGVESTRKNLELLLAKIRGSK